MTITEFLTARLDEDEAVARAAGADAWSIMTEETADGENVYYTVETASETVADMGYSFSGPHQDRTVHVARHDPARVLAEVEAKRRIVDVAISLRFGPPASLPEWVPAEGHLLLRLLALPYADHPDYDEAWRP